MTVQFSGVPVRPFKAPAVNAGSSCQIDYSSRDVDNALEAPTVLRYRVDNITDSVVVLTWTNVETPLTQGSVTIPASLNGMTYQGRDRQNNQVTFEATYADGDKQVSVAVYQLCAVYTGVAP